MALASTDDVQRYLPTDKIRLGTGQGEFDPASLQESAVRVIKSYLAGTVDTLVLASWVSPNPPTPSIICQIAGLLVAADVYANRRSETQRDVGSYAESLRQDAYKLLEGIVTGQFTLLDPTFTPITTVSASEQWSGYPDDDNLADPADGAFFTRRQVFG